MLRRAPFFALFLLLACGDSEPDSLCANVVCGVEGTTCSELDGLCHCGAAEGAPVCDETQACDAAGSECYAPLPAAECTSGTRYTGGSTFVEATSEWGLDGIQGVRLAVADTNGDGWADLTVRRGAQNVDDFGPEGVRRTWLLQNNNGRFEDVTEASGILARRFPEGRTGRPVEVLAFGDVDNDGDQDVYLGVNTTNRDTSGEEASEILLNDGAGNFSLQAEGIIPRYNDVPAGASFVDADRDGNLDLWETQHNYGQTFLGDRLFRGQGNGGFTNDTEAFGVTTQPWESLMTINAGQAHSRAWGALARDLDGDGITELLTPSYGRSPNHLWQGHAAADGTVTFTNESVASGYAFDEDQGWESNQFARCYCAANRDAEGCADVPAALIGCSTPNWRHETDRQPFRLGGNSGATSAGDLDNDGDLDLFTGEIRHWWAGDGSDGSEALINDGNLRFTRPGDEALGLGTPHEEVTWDEGHMTNALFDFDNDGRLDVYVGASDYPGNRGQLFHQESALSFREVPTTDSFEHNRSHGVVAADFDRDGDIDIIVGHSRARCDADAPNNCYETSQVRAFRNESAPGNWLQLHLVGGEGSNRGAIGAQVLVRYGDLVQRLEVDGGHGHYGSQSDAVLHIGLGAACEAEVEVRWPNAAGTTETFTLPAGHRIRIEQGERPVAEAP